MSGTTCAVGIGLQDAVVAVEAGGIVKSGDEDAGNGLRVSVVSAYPFHMHEQACQMERLGALERLLTAVPRRRTFVDPKQVRVRLWMSGARYFARKVGEFNRSSRQLDCRPRPRLTSGGFAGAWC